MATTLTDSGEKTQSLTFISFPIEKTETTADGDLMVWGKATDGSVDSDGQVVDVGWSAGALKSWLNTGGNVRVQHQPQRDPAGKGMEVQCSDDGHWVKSLIVEPVAKRLVEKGVLTAYSVGISRPRIDPDPTGKARGGIIRGNADTQIVELSLVDRPANKNCGIQLVKSADGGSAELTGTVWGSELLVKNDGAVTPATGSEGDQPAYDEEQEPGTAPAEQAVTGKSVRIELPEDVTVGFSPRDLAKVIARRNGTAVTEPDAVKRDFDPNVGGGVDRDKLDESDFAGRGRSFPIVTQADVSDALQSIGRAGEDNYDAATLRRNIKRIARRKGFSVPKDKTRPKKKASKSVPQAEAVKTGGSKPPFDEAAPPYKEGNTGDKAPRPDPQKPKKGKGKGKTKSVLSEEILLALAALAKGTVACDVCKGTGMVDGKKCMKCTDMQTAKGIAQRNADDNDTDSDADEDDKGTDKAQKGWPVPTAGVTGMHSDPAPMHREPDGSYIEEFEMDAGMGDGDREKPSALTDRLGLEGKAAGTGEGDPVMLFRQLGVPHQLGVLHDLLCPAYDPAAVSKAHPGASLAGLDVDFFAQKAIDSASSASLSQAANDALLWTNARTVASLKAEDAATAMLEAHKAFRDANPGPGSAPTPGSISPAKFKRPFITAGHAAESAAPHAKEPSASVPSGGITAEQFGRGLITDGHADDSPSNKSAGMTGVPVRVDYVPTIHDAGVSAMRAMHDHVAQTFPDVCPMELSRDAHEITSRPVPVPAGVPAVSPMRVGQAHKAEGGGEGEGEGELVVKAQKKMRRKLGKKVLSGKMTVDEARTRIGRKVTQKAGGQRGLGVTGAGASAGGGMKESPEPEVAKAATVDAAGPVAPDVIKSALADALAPVLQALAASEAARAEQEKLLKKQVKLLDAMAGQPDTSVSPFKGMAARPPMGIESSGHPGGVRTVAEVAERTQAMMLRELETQFRTSPDPAQREAAWQSILKMRGMTPTV